MSNQTDFENYDVPSTTRRLNDATPDEWDRASRRIEALKQGQLTYNELEALQESAASMARSKQVGGNHYKNKKLQPWDVIEAADLGFFEGNVIKYVMRHKEKGGVEDLQKAVHYLERLIEIEEKK